MIESWGPAYFLLFHYGTYLHIDDAERRSLTCEALFSARLQSENKSYSTLETNILAILPGEYSMMACYSFYI